MTTSVSSATPQKTDTRPPGRRQQLVEVSVFLLLIVPSMLLSFFVVRQGGLRFTIVAVSTIVRDLSLMSLVLFFAWRNGESLGRIGWTLSGKWREVALGVGLFLPFFYGVGLVGTALEAAGFSTPSTPLPSFLTARGTGESLLAIILVAVVAITEETIFRGYLILRFTGAFLHPGLAVFLSAGIFSLGHGYEGSAGVITVGIMGVVLALIYLWRKSLVAPIVIHFLQDFLGIVLLPLLRGS